MRNDVKSLLLLSAIYLLFTTPSIASSPGRAGGLTLRRSMGSRAPAMAETYTAINRDVESLQYNPAGLTGLKRAEIILGYARGFAEDKSASAAFAVPTSIGCIGSAIGYYDAGEAELVDTNGVLRTVHVQQDLLWQIGWAHSYAHFPSVGVSAKILRTELGEAESATAFAGDIGIQHSAWKGNNFGLALLNFGPDVKFLDEADPLPTSLKAGISQVFQMQTRQQFLLATDIGRNVNEAQSFISVGSEYSFNSIAIRLGYRIDLKDSENKDNRFSVGTGFHVGNARLDYSFLLADELDDSHKVTLGFQF
ncbi:MAG: hypothetical protein KCHDKBKB_02087 [Elusimicrobia bacterium]|nr:hypothetical protein [Elusimicrobiota bacterium]